MPGHWAGSERRSTLPPDWATRIRPAILERDNHQCAWLGDLDNDGRPTDYIAAVHLGVVHQCLNRCIARADDVDHIGDPQDHAQDNLRALCSRHHNHRSSRQGNTARAALRTQLRRPPEPHPGLIQP